MQQPNIKNVLYDPEKDIKYEVMAYRALSKGELLESVRYYYAGRKKKVKLKPGTAITILTIIGFNE